MVGHVGYVDQSVTVLDINSLYPYVMSRSQFPVRLVYHHEMIRPRDLKDALGEFDGIADVDLWPGSYPYPIRRGGAIAFVPGVDQAVLAGDELRGALDRCEVKQVRDCYLYERADLFSSFVGHFYSRKTDATTAGNRADALMYKMILNSLHGKFAQKGRKWSPKDSWMAH